MRRPALPGRGFTLVEVMVALAILGIIMTMIWGGFAQTARNKDAVERINDRYHAVRMAMERMQREISMAFVSVHRNIASPVPTPLTAFIGQDHSGADRLDFASFAHRRLYRNAPESDQCELGYFLVRDPNNPGTKALGRREQNRIDEDPEKGGRIDILLEDVRRLEFEYLDPTTQEWVRTWDTTQALGQAARLPTQVKIRVTIPDLRDASKDRVFGTRAVLPITWALNHAAYNP